VDVLAYLDAVQEDVLENVRGFLPSEEKGDGSKLPGGPAFLRRYQVNVLVDHGSSGGAPVVFEDNPAFKNLVGRVEHLSEMGVLQTDFNLVRPGALHRANGGYLVLSALNVLGNPYAWEALKRALKGRQVLIESVGQMIDTISTVSLEPEPIPLDVKVVLLGDRSMYYQLQAQDREFGDLFKVMADFNEEMDRTPENEQEYAQLIATMVRREALRPFDRGGVARVIEHSARMVEDNQKLSIHIRGLVDLLRESSYWACERDAEVVTAEDVQRTIDTRVYRSERVQREMEQQILRDTILLDTHGTAVGQINGLSVLQLGEYVFGRPSRITAQVRMGRGEVVNIEREVELSGPSHSKGVLILSAFLAGRYAVDRPLSLSASLVFEQSYGGVDGDSASSTELYALLSAISGVPLKQGLAVTGSVNQHGRVQAIGGVNDKIEGFFDICKARGFTGEQGVLIPASNVKNLMLRKDVREAVSEGQFQIYPVASIDQGIELLTGLSAGTADDAGAYAEDTVNGRVQRRLAELAEKRSRYLTSGDDRVQG
ncbi:MAG: Lon protease family protein, partial [bacterium]|nr:Lon protease family protein [bacterium]